VRWLLNLLLILFILFVFTSPAFGPVMLSERPVTINLVGDIMLDRGVRYKVDKYAAGDYYSLFTHVPMLGQADITFGNLEGPMSDKGRNVGSIYSFRMAPEPVKGSRMVAPGAAMRLTRWRISDIDLLTPLSIGTMVFVPMISILGSPESKVLLDAESAISVPRSG
jgi:fructose-1,6-bisphosphatase/sedoheptulose 1,7-bisphosphatase-like protein